MTNHIGEQLGNYRLIQYLGKGGFADVYLGQQIFLTTYAAIKVLHTQLTGNDLQAFQNEAQTLAHLLHPNIIRVLEFGIDPRNQMQFLVMDYAPNGTLRRRHQPGTRVSLPLVVNYVRQAAEALQYAHDHNVIHRDVKPENMLLGKNNEVLLSDFGIAKVVHGATSFQTRSITGTMNYMAPEQTQGRILPASDQYALAITAYEWLSGECPFTGIFYEVMMKKTTDLPPPLRQKVANVPAATEQAVMRALEIDPQKRFPSIRDFALALEHSISAQPKAPDRSWPPQPVQAMPPRPAATPVAASPLPSPAPAPVMNGPFGNVTALPRPDSTYIYWPTFTLSIQERQLISSGKLLQEPLRTTGQFYSTPSVPLAASPSKPPIPTRPISQVVVSRALATPALGNIALASGTRSVYPVSGSIVRTTSTAGQPQSTSAARPISTAGAQPHMQVARTTGGAPPVPARQTSTSQGSLSYGEIERKRKASIWALVCALLSIGVLIIGFITVGSKSSFYSNCYNNCTGNYQASLGWESFFVYALALTGLIRGIVAIAKAGVPDATKNRGVWAIVLAILVMLVALSLFAAIGSA